MKKMVTIKLMNGLDSIFEIYLTILSQKTRDENKLPNLQALLFNLEDKECHMKQTIKVNLTWSYTASSSSSSIRGGSNLRVRDD